MCACVMLPSAPNVVYQLGGLIDEAGEDVNLFMEHQQELPPTTDNSFADSENTSSSPVPLRPRSKRLKQKSLREGDRGEFGDMRRRDVYGFLLEGELVPADLVPGVKVAKSKGGYVYEGVVIGMKSEEDTLGASSTSSSSSSASSSQPTPSRNDQWEVRYNDDANKTVWLSWEDAW